jgi:hypothetical protein
MKRTFRLASLALASLCLGGCIFGGTGTDTENGVAKDKNRNTSNTVEIRGVSARVVDADGRPLRGVNLFLFNPEFRPDSGRAQSSLLADEAKALVSDTNGYVALGLKAPGKYVVEGVSAGQTLFFDTLVVQDVQFATPFTFRARALSAFKGKVNLVSGMRIDSGSVFIRGTSRSVKVDAAGNYDLGLLPADAGRMAVGMRYAASPTSVQEVKETIKIDTAKVGPAGITHTYSCKDVPKDSAARISAPQTTVPVSADTLKPEGTANVDTIKVDTTKVKAAALQSCDSLPQGGVVNVVADKSVPAYAQDSAGVPVLVLKDETPVASMFGTKITPAVVVPYAACIPSAGHETTTFDLQLQPAAAGSDILVKDVAEKCLVK